MNNVGKIVQIIGPVLDIRFEDGELPNILNAIEIDNKGQRLVAEVAQHIGDNVVRCISMGSTDGLVRGMDAIDTGEGIKVPVGEETLGRIFNVLGDAVDNMPNPETKEKWCIHREPPTYEEQNPTTEILETGIKVVDLIAPYAKGGKIGLFGGAGVGGTAGSVKASLVGDADRGGVVAFGVRSDAGDVTHMMYRTVFGDVVVITAFGKTLAFVHGVEAFGSEVAGTAGCGAMHHDKGDVSLFDHCFAGD